MLAAAAAQNSPAILNLEDMACEAAALACSFGAMRSRHSNLKNELTAAVRWARIAPAVPANAIPLATSEALLTDTSDFTTVNHWYKVTAGKKGVYQRAPAIIARGLPLPRVTPAGTGAAAANAADSVPFVLATLHPNGTLALCAAARAPANARTPHPTPPADIEVAVDALHRKIALFGAFNAVTLQLAADTGRARPPGAPPPAAAPDNAAAAGKIRVWAQNLAAPAGARATDITARVQIKDNRLVIPATALAPLTARDSARDLSMPAVVLFAEPDIL
jgi:hypothetical protein